MQPAMKSLSLLTGTDYQRPPITRTVARFIQAAVDSMLHKLDLCMMVIASLTLQSLGLSWCPGLGRLLASAAFAAYGSRTWNRLPTALRSPDRSLASFKRQLKTHSSVAALDSAGCSCGCHVSSSGTAVTVQRVRRRDYKSPDSTRLDCLWSAWVGNINQHSVSVFSDVGLLKQMKQCLLALASMSVDKRWRPVSDVLGW